MKKQPKTLIKMPKMSKIIFFNAQKQVLHAPTQRKREINL